MTRNLRIAYWNSEQRLLDPSKAALERQLAYLGSVTKHDLARLEDLTLQPCDLLIVGASHVPDEDFAVWIRGIMSRMARPGRIWIPALILADVSFDVLDQILPEATSANWYFDVMASNQLESLPIRVANLLRIHDHLNELHRYAAELEALNQRVVSMEEQLKKLGNK